MVQYKDIGVAFDGSPDSLKAIKAATSLSKDHQAKLHVMYVSKPVQESKGIAGAVSAGDPNLLQSQANIDTAPMPMNISGLGSDHHAKVHDNLADNVISKAKENVPDYLDAHYEILVGKPAAQICTYIKRHHIDIVVLGNRGFSGIKKAFMGSVSQKVSNDAECSVFVVK